MFFFWIGVMYAGALAAGLSFGKSFRHFLFGLLATFVTTLPFCFFNAYNLWPGKELIQALRKQAIVDQGGGGFLAVMTFSALDIPDKTLWLMVVIITVPAFLLFLLTFNCRKISTSILMATGSTLLTATIFTAGTLASIGTFATFILLIRMEPGVDFYLASTVTAAAVSGLLLIGWTIWLFRRERNGRMLPLKAAGVFAVIFVGFWLLALMVSFPYGYWLLARAEKAGVNPWRISDSVPPDVQLELDRIAAYRKAHSNFELPGETVYRWNKTEPPDGERYGELISESDREYTLTQFDTPEMAEFLAAHRRAVEILRSRDVLYMPVLTAARSYARICYGRAALYRITGQREKILPELLKIVPLETDILGDLPMPIAEIVRQAIRSIEVTGMVEFGPDGPEYGLVYRRELERIQALPVRAPHEGGFAMRELKAALRFFTGVEPERRSVLLSMLYAAPAAAYWGIMLNDALTWAKDFEHFKDAGPYGVMPTENYRRMLVQREAMRIWRTTGLALKTYRSEKGAYPDGLAELVPGYLAWLPRSPVSGEVLSYGKVGDAFNLSVPDMAEHFSWRGGYSPF